MSTTKSDLLQGTLDLLILEVASREAQHGWAIVQRLRELTGDVLQVNQGSLYPALHRLERRGWLASKWGQSENNRRAKFYALTAAGRRQLESERRQWLRLSSAVSRVLSES
jgi:PadR family transcriptional regulator